ncbi:MAG: hemerythrin domain-containing protein [Desulfarculus sp.]|nr:hemerythrin domain-containing protein [Desulfarculus sp.]
MGAPTAELKAEHQGVMKVLAVLEVMCGHLEAGEPVASDHLAQVLEFLRVFVDKCHHGKEEEYLFPALEKTGLPHDSGPIAVMLAEHALGRQLVGRLALAMEGLAAGQQEEAQALTAAGREYVALLRAHIPPEDNVLFALADERLGRAEEAELSKSFDLLEAQRIGPGRHEAFHRLIHELTHIYLG